MFIALKLNKEQVKINTVHWTLENAIWSSKIIGVADFSTFPNKWNGNEPFEIEIARLIRIDRDT